MNVSLDPELEQFIHNQVESGKYTSTDAAIAAGIRLLEQLERIYQGRFEELKREILLGIEQLDRGERLDGKEVIEQLRRENQAKRQASA
jgi:antitoxin ParD1/3/4